MRYCIMQKFTKTAYDVMSVFILIIALKHQACVSYDFYNEFYHKATIVACLASKG